MTRTPYLEPNLLATETLSFASRLALGSLVAAQCLTGTFISEVAAQPLTPAAAATSTPAALELPLLDPRLPIRRLIVSEFPSGMQVTVTALLKAAEMEALSEAALRQGLTDLARIESTTLKGPSPQRLYLLRALLQLALGDTNAALESSQKALRLRGSDPDSVFVKGLALLALKKSLEGLDSMKESAWFGRATFFPESEVLYAQAVGYSQLGNIPKAAESLNAAIASPSSSPAVKVQLSRLEFFRGNLPAALKAARSATGPSDRNAAGNREATMQLVKVLLASSDQLLDTSSIAEANGLSASLLEGVPATSPAYREAFPLRIKSLLASRKPDEAEKMVLAAIKKSPGDLELERLLKQVTVEKAAIRTLQK